MNAAQLRAALLYIVKDKNIASYGVVSPIEIDLLLNADSPKIFVINTSTRGSHWILAYCSDGKHYTVYDSYGVDIINYNNYFGVFRNALVNCEQHQSNKSDTCGQFCLFVAYYLLTGLSLCNIVKLLSHSLECNEQLVCKFYNTSIRPFVSEASVNCKVVDRKRKLIVRSETN